LPSKKESARSDRLMEIASGAGVLAATLHDFNVFTERKHIEKLRYMHRNPVKRGLVSSPELWRWSSFRYYGLGKRDQLRSGHHRSHPLLRKEWGAPDSKMGMKPEIGWATRHSRRKERLLEVQAYRVIIHWYRLQLYRENESRRPDRSRWFGALPNFGRRSAVPRIRRSIFYIPVPRAHARG
jgi:hypothetical protein